MVRKNLRLLRSFLRFDRECSELGPPRMMKAGSAPAAPFQACYTRIRSRHPKMFIYLEFLKTFCEEVNLLSSCEMPACNFMKENSFTHPLHVFCLHFLRIHQDYFFRRGFESLKHNFFLEM